MVHQAGTVLESRYEILEPIGQGGMGAVYKARDLANQQVVALKQLLAEGQTGFATQELLDRFESEWHLLQTLSHPRIPKMLGAFRVDDCGYYLMEFIEGRSLDQVMRDFKASGRRFPEELMLQYALQTLEVLDYLHSRPVPLLHRDIKPQNILIRSSGEAALVDFGLAREGGTPHTKTLVGTLGYAPLEQVRGHPEERSDLYALGATMWHMLVGEQPAPFDIPPLSSRRNDVHPALAEVVDRACQDNPARRYASARKMEAATRQAYQALTGDPGDAERYQQLYLEESPEVIYQAPPPMGAQDFLLRTAVVSAGLLLLMVVAFRVKQRLTVADPIVTASPQASGGRVVPGLAPDPVPPPPPLVKLAQSDSINLSPPSPELEGLFPLPSPWGLMGYTGKLASATVEAPPGAAGGVMFRREAPAQLQGCRFTLGRPQGPLNVQLGFWHQASMTVGISSNLVQGRYVSHLLSGGQSSPVLTRPWNQGLAQQLELRFSGNLWTLRDVDLGQEVSLPASQQSCDNIQIILPPAVQAQVLTLHSFRLEER